MPSATTRSALAIRPGNPQSSFNSKTTSQDLPKRNLKHRPCTSYPDDDYLNLSLSSQGFSPVRTRTSAKATAYDALDRPTKRPMPTPTKTIAVVNSSGRQAASFIRVAVAVGYKVRAQLRNLDGIVATEISNLPNVTIVKGDLYTKPTPTTSASPILPGQASQTGVNHELIKELFRGAQLAFINTTFYGNEVEIGKALADAAVAVNIEHFIYSSMPDHAIHNPNWPSLPLWSSKATIEAYVRSLPTLYPVSAFIYTGIYNNNFTSLPYPLFCMELQPDGSFTWTAPFHPDVPLPWLDAEHDVGPAVLQLIKDGVSRWGNGNRIALAYEMLSPRETCRKFSQGVRRRVRYVQAPNIEVKVKIPNGYRDQLLALEKMYALGARDPSLQPPYFGDQVLEDSCPSEAMELWEGHRGIEEYAREMFPLEEAANGLTWMSQDSNMEEENGTIQGGEDGDDEDEGDKAEEEEEDEYGLTMAPRSATGAGTSTGAGVGASGESTPARREERWLA